jgi:hypothetical protein
MAAATSRSSFEDGGVVPHCSYRHMRKLAGGKPARGLQFTAPARPIVGLVLVGLHALILFPHEHHRLATLFSLAHAQYVHNPVSAECKAELLKDVKAKVGQRGSHRPLISMRRCSLATVWVRSLLLMRH